MFKLRIVTFPSDGSYIEGFPVPLPNLVVAGVRKSATTSLFHYLSQHPQICACRVKEPSYFTPLKYGKNLADIQEYADLFAHCNGQPFRLEASPGYFSGGATIANPLVETLSKPHVVVILRNPIETCWSNYNFLRSRLKIDKQMSFTQYIDECNRLHQLDEDDRFENRDFNSIRVSMYYRFVPIWSNLLGDRFKVILFDEFKNDSKAVVSQLCDWLQIDSAPVDRIDFSVENKTEQYRLRWMQQLALWTNRTWKPFFRRNHRLKKMLRKAYYVVNKDSGDKMQLLESDRERLGQIFAEPNARLAEQLQQSGVQRLPSWLSNTSQV